MWSNTLSATLWGTPNIRLFSRTRTGNIKRCPFISPCFLSLKHRCDRPSICRCLSLPRRVPWTPCPSPCSHSPCRQFAAPRNRVRKLVLFFFSILFSFFVFCLNGDNEADGVCGQRVKSTYKFHAQVFFFQIKLGGKR